MSKKNERIRIVQNKLGQCLASGSTAQYFTYGNIPQKRFDGARKNMLQVQSIMMYLD